MESSLVYVLGIVIVAVALLVGWRGHSVRARYIHGSVVANKVDGEVRITNTETSTSGGADHGGRHGDRIAWVIAIVGVLIVAAQFAHDAFGFLK